MAKITGTLSKLSTPLILTPLGADGRGDYYPRTLLTPGVHVDIQIPDGYYNIETLGRTVDIELVKISLHTTPDDIADAVSNAKSGSGGGKTAGVLLLGPNDEVPIGTRSGTVVIRM